MFRDFTIRREEGIFRAIWCSRNDPRAICKAFLRGFVAYEIHFDRVLSSTLSCYTKTADMLVPTLCVTAIKLREALIYKALQGLNGG